MTLPPAVAAFWHSFVASVEGGDPLHLQERFYEVFSFGDSPQLADVLVELVLRGTKRATAGSVWSCALGGKRPPRPGDLSIVTDGSGAPRCVIETESVEVVPFNEVGADFAATEGEGDGSLAYWRAAHHAYFTREAQAAGRTFEVDQPTLCERFKVVYPAPTPLPGR